MSAPQMDSIAQEMEKVCFAYIDITPEFVSQSLPRLTEVRVNTLCAIGTIDNKQILYLKINPEWNKTVFKNKLNEYLYKDNAYRRLKAEAFVVKFFYVDFGVLPKNIVTDNYHNIKEYIKENNLPENAFIFPINFK